MSNSWPVPQYPIELECKFCRCVLTIALKAKSKATVTEGHASDCPMNYQERTARARVERGQN